MKWFLQYRNYVLIFIGILVSITAKADIDIWWRLKINIYYSENKEYKLIVTPKFVPDKYNFYVYKSKMHPKSKRISRKKERLTQMIIPCTAELYRESETGSILIWKKPLLQNISYGYAIVSNDGSSIATFYGGYDENVFVVYDENGVAKRAYELKEICPFPLNDYLRTKPPKPWLAGARFSDNERIEIVFKSNYARSVSSSFILSKQLVSMYDTESPAKRVYNVKSLEFEK